MNNCHNQSLLPSLYTTCVFQLTLNHFYQKEMGECAMWFDVVGWGWNTLNGLWVGFNEVRRASLNAMWVGVQGKLLFCSVSYFVSAKSACMRCHVAIVCTCYTSLTNSPDHVASDHSAPRTLGIYVTILVVSTAPFLDLSCSELFSVCGRNSEDILCSGINFIIPRVEPQGS